MRVAQVSFVPDPLDRPPEVLIDEWRLTDLARGLTGAGAELLMLQAGYRDASIEREGVRYTFVAEPSSRLPRRLAATAARFSPDVLHVHGLSFPLHTRYLAWRLRGTPIVAQDHANRPPLGWRKRVHRAGLAPIAAVTFTSSDQAAPFFSARIFRDGLPVHEVLEGSTSFSPGDRNAARLATGLAGDPCVLWAGDLNSNKDPLTVIEAFSRALRDLPDAQLWCCYRQAPLLEQVRRACADIEGRVHLLGARDAPLMEDLHRASDFYISGSHREGGAYSAIEALACGASPLVTDIPAFRRVTANGMHGALSKPGDAEGMRSALVEWSGRDREQLRQSARAHFESSLSFNTIGRALVEVYREVIDRQG